MPGSGIGAVNIIQKMLVSAGLLGQYVKVASQNDNFLDRQHGVQSESAYERNLYPMVPEIN